MKKRRVGRPKLGPMQKKTMTIRVSVNPADRKTIEEKAAGMPLSVYLRHKALA